MARWQSRFCEVTRTGFFQFLVNGHEDWWFELSRGQGTSWDLILVSENNQYSKHFGTYACRVEAEQVTEELVAMLLGTFFEIHHRNTRAVYRVSSFPA